MRPSRCCPSCPCRSPCCWRMPPDAGSPAGPRGRERCARRNLELVRLKTGLQPVYATIMISGVVLIVWQGSERVIAGVMTVGGFIAYLELFLRFVNRGHRIPQLVNSLQGGAAGYARTCPLMAPALPPDSEPRFASFRAGHEAS